MRKFILKIKTFLLLLIVAYPMSTLADTHDRSSVINAQETPLLPKKNSPEAARLRGEIAFGRYCILCHGTNADGKGRAAKLFNPKPSNLRLSDKNILYKVMIISKGGEAMGRSPAMPRWDQELTSEQITDIVAYLDSIAVNKPKE